MTQLYEHSVGARKLPQVEIREIPPLEPGELSLLDFHSVVNVVNVIRCELMVIGELLRQDVSCLHASLARCEQLLASIADRQLSLSQARDAEGFERVIEDEIRQAATDTPPRDKVAFDESVANLASVFPILLLRAAELLSRADDPARWEEYEPAYLTDSLRQVFVAVAKNSKGRYRVLTNAALQTGRDYFIDLNFETPSGRFHLPPIFLDVMRDLIANARKYTEPGGDIIAALYQDADGTSFCVKDTGRGIPADELESVVHFGKRGSNVASVRTLGGGFGLTKAFWVTKQFGGRFWIASEVGKGTEIRLWLPPRTGH